MKTSRAALAFLFVCLTAAAGWAQQPQTQADPSFGVNAEYVGGVSPGFALSKGSGLTLNVGAGTAPCVPTVTYAGGTLTMTDNSTNYIYLNGDTACLPAAKTTAFVSKDTQIGIVVTASGVISTVTMISSPFVNQERGIVPRTVTGTTDTILASDANGIVRYTSSSATAITMPPQSTTGFGQGFAVVVRAEGAQLTFTTSATFTYNGTTSTTLVVNKGYGCSLVSDSGNTTYYPRCEPGVLTGGTGVTFTPTARGTEIDVSGSGSGGPLTAVPAQPTLSTTGTAGSTEYDYCAVANSGGGTTSCSAPNVLSTGNATLGSSNYNDITLPAATAGVTYDVYRTKSAGTPATTGKLTTGTCVLAAGTSCTDKGETADGNPAPAINSTGRSVAASFGTANSGFGAVDPTAFAYLKDEFCGTNGDLGWVTTGTITVSHPASILGSDPCELELNANGTTGTISLGGGAAQIFMDAGRSLVLRAYARMVSNFYSANRTNQQIGFAMVGGLTDPNASGFIGFMGSSRTGTTTDFGCTTGGNGLGYNEMDSGIAQDTNPHWFEIDISPMDTAHNAAPATVVVFRIDHAIVCTSRGTNVYTGTAYAPIFGVADNNSVNGDMKVDYWDLAIAVSRP